MIDQPPDHYQVLGLPATASADQVKAAYRRRALRHHPDKHPGSAKTEEFFKRCTEAYNVLSDEQRRERYDLERLRGAAVPELIETLRSLVSRRRRPRRGRDLRVDLELTLEETARPVSRQVSFVVEEGCGVCGGSGAAAQGTTSCPRCAGRGFRSDGFLAVPRICGRCGGQGELAVKPCTQCSGLGTVEVDRSYAVSMPAGVHDGEETVAAGQGEPGRNGGAPGNLRVTVVVPEHPLLRTRGDDVLLDLPVSFVDAALGHAVEVPTLESFVKMRVPPGTQSGRVFRLAGQGLPRRKGGRGDELVTVIVETPAELSGSQRALLEQLRASRTAEMEPQRSRYLEALQKVRDERGG